MTGSLTVCATPIGNLDDISARALEVLRGADLIAAEDTRHTLGLLNHYGIRVPMISCHKDNEEFRSDELIAKMRDGARIVYVSDAGTPAISDPGEILVRKCHEEGIPVTAVPGACAFVTALSMSGMPSRRFVFEGFLPVAAKERNALLEGLQREERTVIFYEAPHRLRKTLSVLLEKLGDRKLAIGRELTKVHEEMELTTLAAAAAEYEEKEPRGEYVLILGGADPEAVRKEQDGRWEQMTMQEHMDLYADLPPKEAMKKVAADRGIARKDVYEALLKEKESRQ